jgi:hypothetical protein
MLSGTDFVRQSLELHLFFARIMKEHSLFLGVAFTPKDGSWNQQAGMFRQDFERLLGDAISIANRNVSREVLQSGEVVTPYTIKAEIATTFFTGINIPTGLTQAAMGLTGNGMTANPMLEQQVAVLNQRALELVAALIQFKKRILTEVLACRLFTTNYPLMIEHLTREALLYQCLLQRLQNRETIVPGREAYEQEVFWNRNMSEHSFFIRGLLDPVECDLIIAANRFGGEFVELTQETMAAVGNSLLLKAVTDKSLNATMALRDFKRQGTEGILACQIRSIITPLLADHVLREANHYLFLLEIFKSNLR